MPLTVFSRDRKAITSVNNNYIMSGFSYFILLNIPLKYILNKIRDTGESYKTPPQISYN